ncbi:MAG: Teichoic acids export ATP-binding protein TagH [Syntrophorhabdus sp. PtaU1.Bin050]|nr:MAG: Teichoic acids export ATP-binding protein TagH [Syntrophorhabdus sp. PtaU1.Bin050]
MSSPIIEINNLSKRYIIGENIYGRGARTFRDIFEYKMKRLFAKNRNDNQKENVLWALRNVSFEVQKGEVIGIIGRNGAGKSTLLKVLSRITEPTKGLAILRGRVASLLEVGTGFSGELTGRENIYLNGSILGMQKSEIKKKFDEIVAFAEVERFLDTPVKRYSSGMYVRLAFAVAAHLEPEILVVDEVLAVGDAEFQKKCLGKMDDVAKGGRTVLFVSHNMGIISKLCPLCLWLEDGKVKQYGRTEPIISAYLRSGYGSSATSEVEFDLDPLKKAQLRSVRLLNQALEPTQSFSCDEPIVIDMLFQVNQIVPALYCWLAISRPDGTIVLMSDSFDAHPNPLDRLQPGLYDIRVTIPARHLGHGDYNVVLNFTGLHGKLNPVHMAGNCCSFRLDDFSSARGNKRPGYLSTLLPWDVAKVAAD